MLYFTERKETENEFEKTMFFYFLNFIWINLVERRRDSVDREVKIKNDFITLQNIKN